MLHNIPRWGSVLGGLILLPFIVPEVVRALAWRILLDPIFGALNYILVHVLHVMPVGIAWLGEPNTALPSVTMVNVWAGLPFFIILCTAGLKAIDAEQYDAAAVDGANAWRRFLHVTLPGMRYVIIVATLLSTILTFNSFGLTYLLTGGGPGGATRVYTILAYEYAISGLRYGVGRGGGDDHGAVPVPADPVPRPLHDGARPTRRRPAKRTASPGARRWPSSGRSGCCCAGSWPSSGSINDPSRPIARRRRRARFARPARRRCWRGRRSRGIGNTILYVAARRGAALRAVAVLLHLRDGVQEHAPDPAGPEHVLADALDAGALPLHALRDAVLDLVPEHHPRGGGQHDGLGAGGGLGGVRAGAPEVARLERHRHDGPGRLPDAAGADVHPAVPHPGRSSSSPTR